VPRASRASTSRTRTSPRTWPRRSSSTPSATRSFGSSPREELTVRGEITIKGVTRPVELTGRATEPITDAHGRERIGLTLSTTLDRTAFGLNWNLPLPSGEPALANDVELVAELYFVREA